MLFQFTTVVKKLMTDMYTLLEKGYIDLSVDCVDHDIRVDFERTDTESRDQWQTKIQRKMSETMLYVHYIRQTPLDPAAQIGVLSAVMIGILAQSGAFFLQMLLGKPGWILLGGRVTRIGAVLLMAATLVLVYGSVAARF